MRSLGIPPALKDRFLRIGLALLVVAMASMLPRGAAGALDTSAYCADGEEQVFLALINDYRAQSGLAPLALSQTLGAAAEFHSVDMATNSYLSHTMLDGTDVLTNLLNHGYNESTYGENIAGGMSTAQIAFETWRGSASHNENMLRSSFTAIGIGRAYNAAAGYGWYWTTIFGGRFDVPGVNCGQSIPVAAPPTLSSANAVATSDLNLRSGPAATFSLLSAVPPGSRLEVTGSEQDGYVPVAFAGQNGWVLAEFISRDDPAPTTSEPTAPISADSAMTTDVVNLRAGPSREEAVLQTVPAGASLTLTGSASGGYLGVTYNGASGWIDAAYLRVGQTSAQTVPTSSTTGRAPAPASAAPAAPSLVTTATALDNLNLRAGPSREGRVLLVIPRGTVVDLTGENTDGYLGVTYGGTTGWADAAYLA